jgi:hypothetical protein
VERRSACADACAAATRAQGFLTLFSFLLPGAYINPAVTVIEFIGGAIKPRRFALLRACPLRALSRHSGF